jgi:hypothetical protein
MPPAGVEGWSDEDVVAIERWLDGGMLP